MASSTAVARNEDVAGVLRRGDVGDDEAVAIVMEDEAAGEFVAARARGWGWLVDWRRCGLGSDDARAAITFPF